MKHAWSGSRPGIRRGGAIVETVLVLSLLLMLSFGAAEYSYFMFVKSMTTGAAREGARAAIPSTAVNSDVTSAISSEMSAAHIASNQYTVTLSPTDISTAAQGSAITVTVTCTWGTVGVTPLPVALGGIPTNKKVIGVAVMRKEG